MLSGFSKALRLAEPILLILAFWGLACGVHPFAGDEKIALRPGAVYPRALNGGKPYHFRFRAAAGQLLHLEVDQRGVDIVVTMLDPAHRLIYEVDSPQGKKGEENVLVVTPAAGEYVLVVAPFIAGVSGAFALEVREVRPARGDDRARAAAAASFGRAERRLLSGNFEAAIPAYRDALPRLAALGDRPRQAEAEWRLGQALLETGELREAATALEGAVSAFRGLADRIDEARACNNLGAAWRKLGEPVRASAAYQSALAIYRAAGNREGTASAINNLGLVCAMEGDFNGAIDRFEEALALWNELGSKSAKAATLQNLGSLWSLLGHDDDARDRLAQALELRRGENDPRKLASLLLDLGSAEHLAGRPERALDDDQEALALARQAGDRSLEIGLWDRRGSALRALHRDAEAAESYLRALDLSRVTGSRRDEGNTLANLGSLDLETGDVQRARERLTSAIALLEKSDDPNGEVYARCALSRAERRLGDPVAARDDAAAAVARVEELHGALRGALHRGQFLATRFSAYEELVSSLVALERREPGKGHVREALEAAERARAQNLFAALAEGPGEDSGDAEAHQRRDALDAEIAEIQTMGERRQTLAERDPRDPRLPALDAALRARWLELDRLSAQGPHPRPAGEWAAAADIQSLAGAGTLLVVYMLAEPESFAWTVDRNSIELHVLPGRERIEALARRVAAGLAQSPEAGTRLTVERALADLSQAVLAPLGPRLAPGRRLVILADGALHLVAFGALPAPTARAGGIAQAGGAGEPLLVEHEIAMIPSATVLLAQRRRLAGRRPAPGIVAVLADPVFTDDDERLATGRRPPRAREAARNEPGPFARLPFAGDEARAIAGLVPRDKALLALGASANRDLVLSGALRGYQILHFATHGLLDPVLPERSGIVLAQRDAGGHPRPGFLAAPAVAGLDLPAELAVLSGCQTGLGRELRGEGLVGLTQAFFRAGTRRVVVSLWSVRDRATAELMARFYRRLLVDRLPPAAALRAAQLSLRSEPSWRAPYYWAGFSLHGDWR